MLAEIQMLLLNTAPCNSKLCLSAPTCLSQLEIQAVADLQEQGVPLASDQIQFSLLYRKHEKEGLLKTAKQLGVSVIGYSPLSQGLLTGKLLMLSDMAGVACSHLIRCNDVGCPIPQCSKPLQMVNLQYSSCSWSHAALVMLSWLAIITCCT